MLELKLITKLLGSQVVMELRCQFRLPEKTTENVLLPARPS